MSLKAFFTSSLFIKSIFAFSLLILIFISGISYKHTITVTESGEWVVHTYKVQLQLEQLISYIKDAETGERGFIITRDSSYLHPYLIAGSKTTRALNELKKLTADNPQQQINLASLSHLIDMRFTFLENSVKQSFEIPFNKTRVYNSLLNGKNEMDIIRAHVTRMINLEMHDLKEHQKKYEHEISFTPLLTLLLLAFSLTVFIFSYYKINKDLEILKKSNEELLITTESFKNAEEIGDFSSWCWDLDSNEFTYSGNHAHLLASDPFLLKPGIEEFLEFVHPDDKAKLREAGEQLRKNTTYPVVYFRLIRKDGILRYFKSMGKLLNDVNGKRIFIGINSDITQEHLNNIALEERNRDLEQSNKELASFNHIASHDLQEPLRKIQTFISRISGNEETELSERGKEYFTRIRAAAERMRMLIDDLLLFSRANRVEKIFEKTDLNILLDYAKQELAQAIEEKNARIQTVHLPRLTVISFQIQQLFVNLIGNSLKYSQPGRTPLIQIDCKIINPKDFPALKSQLNKKYYKISITDNGKGFEQEYTEKIFILFNRLNNSREYPGTGIGLSICKKIIANHRGLITADGKPGIGAAFHIILPA